MQAGLKTASVVPFYSSSQILLNSSYALDIVTQS